MQGDQTVTQKLEGNQKKLQNQEEILLDTLGLMKDTHGLLVDGKQNLDQQTGKINTALDHQNQIKAELGKADAHTKAIARNEGCMKCLLVLVALLMFIADIVAFLYKVMKPSSK